MHLLETLSNRWTHVQEFLFPFLRREVGPLTPKHERLITVLDIVSVERFVPCIEGLVGRTPKDRQAIARAYVAKHVFNFLTTSALVDALHVDVAMRRICGWESSGEVPSKSTFSRAFGEFAAVALPSVMHEALVSAVYEDRLVEHVSRDSTAIEAREKPDSSFRAEKVRKTKEGKKRNRGRPKKEEGPTPFGPKEEKRLDKQMCMTLDAMLKDLPTHCGVGAKHDAKGHLTTWNGYKFHIDTADGDIPVACILTSAELHDSQVAIPLAEMTADRVASLYALMDAAYDAPQIFAHEVAFGHAPIIAKNPRRGGKAEAERELLARRKAGVVYPETVRFKARSGAERVNSNLKDNYGGRFVRVRGHAKVLCHLMFGILALTVEQVMRFVA